MDAEAIRRKRRRRIVVGAVVGGLAVAIAVFVVLWNRKSSGPVHVSEALRKFHATSSTHPTTAPAALRPREGVYTYTGSGTEHLSTPPKTQEQGPEIPGTVTYQPDGCWTFRVDYSTSHWQTWNYCSRDGALFEGGGLTFQSWDFVVTKLENVSTFRCDPPIVDVRAHMKPGDSWHQSCAGSSNQIEGTVTSAGRYRFVGKETLEIGGRRVAANRFRQERKFTGSQTGTQSVDFWFAEADGLPLRNERKVTVDSSSPIGTITYTEEGRFVITSMVPRT